MATFTWYLQGGTDTTIASTDYLQFAAGTFGSLILVGNYNSSTHVEAGDGTDKSSGNSPNNNKYISSSEIDVGGGTVNLDTISDSDAALSINFSHTSSVETFGASFYAYGSDTSSAPSDMTIQAAEVGDSNWTNAEGSGSALGIADHTTAATSHDFYIALSGKPTAIGNKTCTYRFELSYS